MKELYFSSNWHNLSRVLFTNGSRPSSWSVVEALVYFEDREPAAAEIFPIGSLNIWATIFARRSVGRSVGQAFSHIRSWFPLRSKGRRNGVDYRNFSPSNGLHSSGGWRIMYSIETWPKIDSRLFFSRGASQPANQVPSDSRFYHFPFLFSHHSLTLSRVNYKFSRPWHFYSVRFQWPRASCGV